jgi:hypothetical protein
MADHHLAVYTFGQLLAPYESQKIKGFRDAEPGAFAAIDRAEGLIARSGYDGDPGPESWGEQVFPKYWVDNGDGAAPSTLSLWQDIESIMAATYRGVHGAAYRRGRNWFVLTKKWPGYVLWWVPAGHRPDWAEGIARFEHLGDNGPSLSAFDFKRAFLPDGTPTKADMDRMKEIAARNEGRAG